MRSRLIFLYLIALAVWAISGCSSRLLENAIADTPTPEPTAIPPDTVPPPTATDTATSTTTPTRTATSTSTSTPTKTSTPTRTATSTPTRTRTPTPVPTPWPPPPAESHGGCQEKTMHSAAIGKDLPYIIYLPPGYSDTQTKRRYPVVYLLSGLGGNYKEWAYENINLCTQMDDWILNDKLQPLIVVMPTGREDSNLPGCDARYPGLGSYWFNHPLPPVSDGKRWSDFVWNDLVNAVDSSYRTIVSRTSRAVGGLSAGANGALSDALNHPEEFSVVGSHSASFRRADGALQCFGTQDYFDQYDPIWLIENRQTWRQLTIWLDDGDQDQEWGQANRDFRNILLSLGIPHEWHELYGDHVPPYWAANVKLYIQWYASKLQGQ